VKFREGISKRLIVQGGLVKLSQIIFFKYNFCALLIFKRSGKWSTTARLTMGPYVMLGFHIMKRPSHNLLVAT
jgi:hypothetical protein